MYIRLSNISVTRKKKKYDFIILILIKMMQFVL